MTAQVIVALAPAALLIALGWVLRHRQMLPDTFWGPAEWLSYHVLLPALFIHGLATADLGTVPVGGMFAVLIGSVMLTAALTAGIYNYGPGVALFSNGAAEGADGVVHRSSGEAAAMAAEPMPDSLEKMPRATPNWMASMMPEPTKPPVAAVPVNASVKIRARASGMPPTLASRMYSAPST